MRPTTRSSSVGIASSEVFSSRFTPAEGSAGAKGFTLTLTIRTRESAKRSCVRCSASIRTLVAGPLKHLYGQRETTTSTNAWGSCISGHVTSIYRRSFSSSSMGTRCRRQNVSSCRKRTMQPSKLRPSLSGQWGCVAQRIRIRESERPAIGAPLLSKCSIPWHRRNSRRH